MEMTRAWLLVAISALGCGRLDFEPRADAAPPDHRCDWTGALAVGPLVHHTELDQGNTEYDPFLLPGDPLTINYVARGDTGDLYTAHRASVDALFDAPVLRADLSTPT